MDAATRGFQDKETAMRISQDMEDSMENGGKCFRNCYDWRPIYETGELRQVLGLRWDTEMDKISVDVKINYCEKDLEGLYRRQRRPKLPRSQSPKLNQ